MTSTSDLEEQFQAALGDDDRAAELEQEWRDAEAAESEQRTLAAIDAWTPPILPGIEPFEQPRARGRGITAAGLRAELLTIGQLKELPPAEWLVDGILFRDTLALGYGPPGTAKSFAAIDLGLSVATGSWWFKREVRKGPVVYCAGEGRSGLWPRVEAWQSSRMVWGEIPGFVVLPRVVNLLDDQAVTALCDVLTQIQPHLVVIDTLARAMVGAEENSTRDMGRAVDSADRIRRATRACVLALHHDNRAGSNPRGNSSLDGAVDTVIQFTKDDLAGNVKTIRLHNTKQKDAAEFPDLLLALTPHADSCILAAHHHSADELSDDALTMLRTLDDIAGPEGVSTSVWRTSSGVAERTFYRWRKRLAELELTATTGAGRGALHALTTLGKERTDA